MERTYVSFKIDKSLWILQYSSLLSCFLKSNSLLLRKWIQRSITHLVRNEHSASRNAHLSSIHGREWFIAFVSKGHCVLPLRGKSIASLSENGENLKWGAGAFWKTPKNSVKCFRSFAAKQNALTASQKLVNLLKVQSSKRSWERRVKVVNLNVNPENVKSEKPIELQRRESKHEDTIQWQRSIWNLFLFRMTKSYIAIWDDFINFKHFIFVPISSAEHKIYFRLASVLFLNWLNLGFWKPIMNLYYLQSQYYVPLT